MSINVSNVDAGIAFYTGVLGGTLRDDRPDFAFGGAWIDLGASQLHLIDGAVPAKNGQHFAVRVADIDDTVGELRSKGFTVADPFAVGADRQTFVSDPSGNVVEFHEVGQPAQM